MKIRNYLPSLLFLFFGSSGFGQTEKGKFVLSGNTDLNFLFSNITMGTDSVQTGKSKSNQYGVTIGAGYFVTNNFAVGISGTYSYSYSKIESNNYINSKTESITRSFTILPQVQYYFPVEGKLKPVLAIGAGYGWLEERDSRVTDNNNTVYSLSGPAFTGGGGVSYFITNSVAFDLGFQYSYSRFKDKLMPEQIQKQNQFAGRMGVSVFF